MWRNYSDMFNYGKYNITPIVTEKSIVIWNSFVGGKFKLNPLSALKCKYKRQCNRVTSIIEHIAQMEILPK